MSEPIPPKLQVFLCHSSLDKPRVRELYDRLSKLGWIKPWLDKKDLLPGQNWQVEIPKAVRGSEIVLVCLSKTSITSDGYVHKEIKYALDVADQKPENTIYLIPMRLEECTVPERLGSLHWVDYFEEDGFEQLLKALQYRAQNLGIRLDKKAAPQIPSPAELERESLLPEINDPNTSHKVRSDIGKRLGEIGDTRRGVGIDADGIPDIEWLPVAPGGRVEIKDQTFSVPPFYIAKYPVTYAQYDAFVKAKDGFNNPVWWRDMPPEYQMQKLDNDYIKPPNYPRDNISWYQSVAFGRWLNHHLSGLELPIPGDPLGRLFIVGQNVQVRLPLEWEWQWAAQGGREQRKYPWGNWKEGYANTDEAGLDKTVAVGMYPQGAAVCKAEDMSGNVWEWCLNKYSNPKETNVDNSTDVRVLRGGAFYYGAGLAASAIRVSFHLLNHFFRSGFRLVWSSPILRL